MNCKIAAILDIIYNGTILAIPAYRAGDFKMTTMAAILDIVTPEPLLISYTMYGWIED